MISELAAEDLEEMRERGLNPSVRDIIRLNAMGLRIERCGEPGDIYALPRVATLGKLHFREPTIAHGLWIDRVLHFISDIDFESTSAVNAYALSRPADSLPDAADIEAVKKAIDDFCKGPLSGYTFKQVHLALTYALRGCDETACEVPAANESKDEDSPVSDTRSIYAGVLIETAVLSLGLSLADIKSMTRSQAECVKMLGLCANGHSPKDQYEKSAQAHYYATRDEIESRLKSEKEKAAV